MKRTTYRACLVEDEQKNAKPQLNRGNHREHKGYIGERYDEQTGLLFLNARYYDPDLARFISPDWWDPNKPGVGTNRYAYAGQDPINNADGNGHYFGIDDGIAVTVGAIFGAVGQGISDAISGELSSAGAYGRAALAGAAGGEATLYGGPVLGCAVAGATLSALNSAAEGHSAKTAAKNIAVGAIVGAVAGGVGAKVQAGVTRAAGKLAKKAKEGIGELGARAKGALRGRRVVDRQVPTGIGIGKKVSIVDQVQRTLKGREVNVEAKFRTTPPSNPRHIMTPNQKVLFDKGELVPEITTAPGVGQIAGLAATSAGATAGADLAGSDSDEGYGFGAFGE